MCRVEEEDLVALSEGVVISTSQQRGAAQVHTTLNQTNLVK
jgi:hypothetical protein